MRRIKKWCGYCENVIIQNGILICPINKKIVEINDTCEDFETLKIYKKLKKKK